MTAAANATGNATWIGRLAGALKARAVLLLVVGIPLAAVLMGAVTLYVAFSHADPGVRPEQPAMSKTSWRERQ